MAKQSKRKAEEAAASAAATAAATASDGSKLVEGVAPDGTTFLVPHTRNVVQNLFRPSDWNVASVAVLTIGTVVGVGTLILDAFPLWLHIVWFLFWRLCYNVGLGAILNSQSTHQSVTKWYQACTNDAERRSNSLRFRFVSYLARHACPDGHKPADFPDAFNAWVVYRLLVDVILANDLWAYLLMVFKCWQAPPLPLTLSVVLQYVVGVALVAFNYWAKVDAHRCIGEYCWYWGDFFFLKNENLTFDGIFELFPHPMYTVGYSLYYGFSLICRSYTMLFVSVFAHMLQMAFLVLVEEPHIQRTYGTGEDVKDQAKSSVLYDPRQGYFDTDQSVLWIDLDPFRAGDFALVCFMLYGLVSSYFLTPFWCVVQVIVWRLFHWVGLGYVLWAQGHRQMFTRHFTKRGYTLHEAFTHWKGIYNLSLSMNHVVFVGCALRSFTHTSLSDFFTPLSLTSILLGGVLILLNIWSSTSTYSVVGDFGWYYGDFFIPQQEYKHNLVYTGVYRFLNNPDCVTGYAAAYGLALITQSWVIFGLAVASQIMNIIFLNVIEVPHMKKLYDSDVRRHGPLNRVLSERFDKIKRKLLPDSERIEKKVKKRVSKIRSKTMKEIFDMYKKIDQLKDEVKHKLREKLDSPKKPKGGKGGRTAPSIDPAVSKAIQQRNDTEIGTDTDTVSIGKPLTVRFKTVRDHSETDWIGLYDVDTPSVPGVSGGRWVYVPPEASGEVKLASSVMPREAGVFQLRYHVGGSYDVIATSTIRIIDEFEEDGDDDDGYDGASKKDN